MTTPNEQYHADSEYESLAGTTDGRTGVPYPPAGCSGTSSPTILTWVNRQADRINALLAALAAGRVVQEAGLVVGIWPLDYRLNGYPKSYNGATGEAVNDNATTYLYLDASNSLVKSLVGFPADPSTHLPLAEVTCANGSISSIVDRRPLVQSYYCFGAGSGLTFANGTYAIAAGGVAAAMLANLAVTTGKIADAAVTETKIANLAVTGGKLGAASVSEAKLADAIADAIPTITLTVGAESANAIAVTVQVKDIQGNTNANRFLVTCWLSDAAYGAETATGPDGTVSFTAGTLLQEVTVKKRWLAIGDATGKAILSIGHSVTGTWYLNVAVNGRVYASSAIAFA